MSHNKLLSSGHGKSKTKKRGGRNPGERRKGGYRNRRKEAGKKIAQDVVCPSIAVTEKKLQLAVF